jgi:hypothetical protein
MGELLPVEPWPGDEYGIREVTITQVDLLYSVNFVYNEENYSEPPLIIVQPVWRFTGTTDTNEIVEIFVQAVADEYIQE